MKKYLQEIENELNKHEDNKRAEFLGSYFKIGLNNLGISMPNQRAIFKEGYSFSKLGHEEQSKIWNHIYKNGKTFETRNQALFYFEYRKKQLSPADWRILKSWAKRVDNWATSDALCNLISQVHEQHPKLVYPQLVTWNSSKNPWLRRISIVSLIYYASLKRKAPPLSKVFPLVERLLMDEDPYVRKGVGWTLRECYKIDPKQTYAFLKKHIRDLAPVSFSYATEKVTSKKKSALKNLRKG